MVDQRYGRIVIFTPDNAWIYAADMGSDEILAFPFDGRAGRVGGKIRAYRAAPGSGPRHVLSRHGLIYLLNELGNTLVTLRPEADGTLTEVQSVSSLPSDSPATATRPISTDDNRMIVANNLSDAMTIFDVDARGELRTSDQVTVRRPVFIAHFGPQ